MLDVKLMRLGAVGCEIPIAMHGNDYFDLRPLTTDINGNFLQAGGIARARAAIQAGDLPAFNAEGQRVGSPIERPSALFCIGQNYAEHAKESGASLPSTPVVFLKTPNTVIGPNDDVRIPRGSTHTDWEIELAVVVGKSAAYLNDPSEARDYIAGFAISNDVSERAFQLEHSGGQWSKGKCCQTFNPLGPWLVPVDQFPKDHQFVLQSSVNGETRQHATTADMLFDIDFLVWHLSHYTVLEPGDVINTGTPAGVALSGRYPYLKPGDTMVMEIEHLGRQSQRLIG